MRFSAMRLTPSSCLTRSPLTFASLQDTEYLVLAKHQYMGAINTYRSFSW